MTFTMVSLAAPPEVETEPEEGAVLPAVSGTPPPEQAVRRASVAAATITEVLLTKVLFTEVLFTEVLLMYFSLGG
ncbi:hypothetical protein [Nonomuraea sp. NPDC049750]|uniref:hypothetical protein n=1 Tax=Nonomuraea sp. NPDC049750 TaxID=3154738 RepID=UPI0033E90EED